MAGKLWGATQLLKNTIARGLLSTGTDARGAPMTIQLVFPDVWQLIVNAFSAAPLPLPAGAAAPAPPPPPPPPPPRAEEEESESSAEEAEEEEEEEKGWKLGDGGGGYWDTAGTTRSRAVADRFAPAPPPSPGSDESGDEDDDDSEGDDRDTSSPRKRKPPPKRKRKPPPKRAAQPDGGCITVTERARTRKVWHQRAAQAAKRAVVKSRVTSLSLSTKEQLLCMAALLGAGWNSHLSRKRLSAAVAAGQNDIALAAMGLINAILPTYGAIELHYDEHHHSLEVRVRWTPFSSRATFTTANTTHGPI